MPLFCIMDILCEIHVDNSSRGPRQTGNRYSLDVLNSPFFILTFGGKYAWNSREETDSGSGSA